ncbi:protease inhibitor I42 family protein [Chloroflexota bacterium]
MLKTRWIICFIMVTLLSLVSLACSQPDTPPSPLEPTIQNAIEARDTALNYLKTLDSNIPGPEADWKETDTTTPGLIGGVQKQYTTNEWTIGIAYNVVRPDQVEYHIVISSVQHGLHWEGKVKADATVNEINPLKEMSVDESKIVAELTCDDFMNNDHITNQVEVNTSDIFTIILCSNPSTGFQWSEEAQISGPATVKQTGHNFISLESDTPPPPGTPGQEIWTFEALEEGDATISMEYSRPWEGGEKGEWTFELTVSVK